MKVLGQSVVEGAGAVIVFEVSPDKAVAVSLAARAVSARLPVSLLPLGPVERSSDDRQLAEHLVREVAYGRVDRLDVVPDGSNLVPEPSTDVFRPDILFGPDTVAPPRAHPMVQGAPAPAKRGRRR